MRNATRTLLIACMSLLAIALTSRAEELMGQFSTALFSYSITAGSWLEPLLPPQEEIAPIVPSNANQLGILGDLSPSPLRNNFNTLASPNSITAVPEPSAIALLILGGLAVFLNRKKLIYRA